MSVYSHFTHNSQKLETIQMPFNERLNTPWYITTMGYYSAIKMREDWYLQLGQISRKSYQVKKATLKNLHNVRFHLYNILAIRKSQKQRLDQWLPGGKEGVGRGGCVWKNREPCDMGTVLCLDCDVFTQIYICDKTA